MSDTAAARTTKPRPAQRERGRVTRDRVLDVAEALFAAHGFAGTGLRQIAREVGIQQPSLYRHFDSKGDLYAAVLDRAFRPVIEGLDQSDGEEPGVPDPRELASWVIGVLAERPDVPRLLLQEVISSDGSLDPVLRRALEPVLKRAVRLIARSSGGVLDQKEASLWLVTMFFAGTGFFAASPILELLGSGRPANPSMLTRQRRIMTTLENALRARMRG